MLSYLRFWRDTPVAEALDALAWQADFRFLYHPRRHLLHIGYQVDKQLLDTSFYDLLASESRTTSLLAIAKGDVPVRHWAALGRPFFASGRRAVLQSWSGSMFEYLMPSLVMGPVQRYCRAWLSAPDALPPPSTYRTELADAAWRAVRASKREP